MTQLRITIERQYGSGGKTIGQMLAERLQIPCYDRDIITMASENSGINASLFSDERLKPGFWKHIKRKYQDSLPIPPEQDGFVADDNLYRYQADMIRQLAEQGPCVLIGRCADHILRERKDVVRVLVHAPEAFCLQEAAKVDSLPEQELKRKIAETDTYRAKYYRYYTGQDWLNASNYDIALNSAVLGFEGTADTLEAYFKMRETAR